MTSAGNALDVFQQGLATTQNNIGNASTAGYASQTLNLTAQPFDTADGLTGGVAAGGLIDSRDQYAEESVQQQTQTLGFYTAQAQSTATLQNFFDVTGTSGVSSALQNLFQSFSSWSVNPNDATARQTVLNAASTVAGSFNSLASSLTQQASTMDTQVASTVSQINTLEGQIQQYNQGVLENPTPDPGAQAQLHSALDSLSQLVNFSTVQQSDGTVSVVLGDGTPLVLGSQTFALSSNASVSTTPPPVNAGSPPTGHILDSQGNDITSEITGGQLGGELDVRNRVLGSVLGDSQQQGSLNQLAQSLADTVNQILESGTVSSDVGAANGTALFTYTSGTPTNVAASLAVNPAITTADLAPVDSSGNANGNAQQLAALSSATSGAGTINGQSLIEYFGSIASVIGQENSDATDNETTQQQVVAQATSLRDQVQGVSLNAQAADVMQFQQSYQAIAQVLNTLNTISQSLISMMEGE